MPHNADTFDRILVDARYTLHHRRSRRARWQAEARPNYILLFLLDGEWRFNVAGRTGAAQPGDALIALPREMLRAHAREAAESLFLSLSPTLILDCAVRARVARSDALIEFDAHHITGDARLVRYARDLTEELAADEAGKEMVTAALVEQTVVHLLRRYAKIRRADALELTRAGLVDRRLRRAVELMHAQLERELPLEELAAAAYLSPFHFARLFKRATGTTPHAYLSALRLARAEILLAETDLSITEVATRVGYNSPSHFAKVFRQTTGLAPRAFRAASTRGKRSASKR